jgi:hypothetical protein
VQKQNLIFYKFKFLGQKLSLTLKATLSILHVPQEQLHFAEQKLHFDEIDAAQLALYCSLASTSLTTTLSLHLCGA